MTKYRLTLCLAAAAACFLTACGGGGSTPIDPATGQPQAQAPSADHTAAWAAGAGLLGYMAGRQTAAAGAPASGGVIHRTTVVNQTVVQKKIVTVAQPSLERPISRPSPSVAGPASYGGSRRR